MNRTERVIISGATSGIGRAIATNLASRAAFVGILGRRADAAAAVAESVRQAGAEAVILRADVASASEVAKAVEVFVSRTAGLDTVVASAGVAIAAPVADFALSDWDKIVSINLGGTFYLAKYTIPHLIRSRGTFTAVSSDAGTQGAQGYGAYCATKHGINGLIKCIALEYGAAGVRANAVCPGFVETPMADQLFKEMSAEQLEFFKKSVPLGRFAKPEEVAAAVAHLTSSDARYTNGMLYAIDGGSTAGYYAPPA